MEDTSDTRPSQHCRTHAHRVLREAMEADTGSLQVQVRQGPRAEKERELSHP